MQKEKKQINKQVSVLAIEPKEIEKYWNLVEFFIRQGIKYEDNWVSVPLFKKYLKENAYQLFIMFGSDDGEKHKVFGTFVTRITALPNFKQVEVVLLAGEKRELWQDEVSEMLEHIAVQYDCKRIAIFARKGWERFLNSIGWETKRYLFTKEIKK